MRKGLSVLRPAWVFWPGVAGWALVATTACGAEPAVRTEAAARAPLFCFDDSDPALVERMLKVLSAQPPTWQVPYPVPRWALDTFGWRGEATIGAANRAQGASLTYSFVPDGGTWGLDEVVTPGDSTGPADLNAALEALFGTGNIDLGREYIRQSLAAWTRVAGVSYREVADDGAPMSEDTVRSALRGDIRIGGISMGINGVLAYNAFPSPTGSIGTGGGDMVINSSYFSTITFNNAGNDYLGFRNTVTHENGHGLGLIHVVPCNGSKLMEPFILTLTEGVQTDDARSIARMNGDRFAGNNSPGTAGAFGNLTTPVVRSVIERGLSTNGSSGFGNTDEDFFRFTTDVDAPVTISVTPTGGVYENLQQTAGCLASNPDLVNADIAGNLNIELRDAAGSSVLFSSSSAPAGSTESLTIPSLAAGTYVVKVYDAGPNSAVNQIVQLYDLLVRVGTSAAPPVASAGLDKRIGAGENCFFIGDINSAASEAGLALDPTGFDWDLDDDGVFEVINNPRPVVQYVSNGDFDVTLRVRDELKVSAEDTITVTVTGAQTTLTDLSPAAGAPDSAVPIVLTGTNLRALSSAAQVSVSGSGVIVTGSPVPNPMGSVVTGLSLVIDKNATPGERMLTVDFGEGAGLAAFMVIDASGVADLSGDGVVDGADLAMLLASWGVCGACAADLNNDGVVDGGDLAILLAAWG